MLKTTEIYKDICAIRKTSPLVHNITNYVVMNTTANALLAIGASPVMAHAVEEVEEMVLIAQQVRGALVINIGTLSEKWIIAMSIAMKAAKHNDVPIVFDPVGAGATQFRTNTCKKLLNETAPEIIRGNASEILSLIDSEIKTKGVDSSYSADFAMKSATTLAEQYDCIVCVSGEKDIITDGKNTITVFNGHPLMPKVTGLGCTASALTGAFAAVNDNFLYASAHAMYVMGITGEIAAKKSVGPGTLQLNFYDTLFTLSEQDIANYIR